MDARASSSVGAALANRARLIGGKWTPTYPDGV